MVTQGYHFWLHLVTIGKKLQIKVVTEWLPYIGYITYMDIEKCPLTASMRVVGGKWKPFIILALRKSPKRFGKLNQLIPGISKKVLASHLAEMVKDKLLTRQTYAETPPRVEYSLTDKARELVPIFKDMRDWGRHLVEEE